MNNLNQEDLSRYVPESDCDYLIDQKLPKQVEPNYLEDSHFRMVLSLPFLDSTHTAFPYRSFYVSIDDYEKRLKYNPYYLLRRVKEEAKLSEVEYGRLLTHIECGGVSDVCNVIEDVLASYYLRTIYGIDMIIHQFIR